MGASTIFYLGIALLASAPAWIVRHPPLQDLPFHLATLRVIKSFHDPAFGFDRTFVMTLGRTQYLFYYLVGAVLATVTGVFAANVVLVSAYLGGTALVEEVAVPTGTQASNLACAIAAALVLGVEPAALAARLAGLRPTMRSSTSCSSAFDPCRLSTPA